MGLYAIKYLIPIILKCLLRDIDIRTETRSTNHDSHFLALKIFHPRGCGACIEPMWRARLRPTYVSSSITKLAPCLKAPHCTWLKTIEFDYLINVTPWRNQAVAAQLGLSAMPMNRARPLST